MHEGLDARHVPIERGEVVPPRVTRIELDARIELPARPRIPRPAIRRAVIHDVVDAGDEEPIDGRPHVGQPHAEVFAEPRRGLGRHQPPSGHVRRGRRPFEPLNLGAFGLRNVARGVEIEQAGRRSVGLIADETAVTFGPRRPLRRERLEEQIRDGFAIVREHARAHVGVTATEERREMPAEIVAAAFLEFGEEARRPIGLASRVIDFIGVVEERAKAAETMSRERAIERQQILSDRVGREMVDDEALTPGRGALDQFPVPAGEEGVECPTALGGDPVQPPVRLHARRKSTVSPASEYAISTASGRSRGYFTCSNASACRFLLAAIGSTRSLMVSARASGLTTGADGAAPRGGSPGAPSLTTWIWLPRARTSGV